MQVPLRMKTSVGVGLFYLSFAFYQDDQHILAAAAVAAAVEDEIDDSDDERKSREDVKVDDHNVLAEQGHEHVEKEVTIVSHDGDAHQSVEIREESASTVVKAAVVEAKAEEVVKKVEVEKKLEEQNEVSRTLVGLTTKTSHLSPSCTQLTRMFLSINCTRAV